jgi:hypothetical protein
MRRRRDAVFVARRGRCTAMEELNVDELLARWGAWARGRVGVDLGLNPRTPLGRLIEEGAMVPSYRSPGRTT